ncbi:MAG: ANTAR domain-containing protein [Actinophytocola sp.]|uniref:ANTAR domain-containing protein n=1 Tax=Actinophytocola sp. TaxID=1872138 RepID=UPI003D6B8C9C
MEPLDADRHALVMHRSNAWQRSRIVSWVADALARGDKVLHRSADPAPRFDELGEAGQAARESGQLEIIDAARCQLETDGLHWALRELHENLVRAAFDGGYAGVALTADAHALHVLAPEPAERLAHEHDLDRLTALPGVRALCCYDLRVEQPDVLEAVAGVHHRNVEDVLWSVRLGPEHTLLVRGEIDADNAGRFAAALRVAAAHGVHTVDLAETVVLTSAGVRAFDGALDIVRRHGDRLRLVNIAPAVHQSLTVLPFGDEHSVELVAGPARARVRPVEPVFASRLGHIARELTKLTAGLYEANSVADVLERIAWATQELVAGADLVSFTLRGSDGEFHTPIRTDPVAVELDRLQYALDEGPCLDAARASGPAVAVSEDLAVERAWPRFGPAAAAHGMRSVLATALLADARPSHLDGALNIYSREPGGITVADRDTALILASHASLALASSEAVTLQELQAAQLRRAIDSRDVIGQAKGILMQRRGITADEAFDLLRDLSQRLNVKVTDLARILASRRNELDVPDSAGLPATEV